MIARAAEILLPNASTVIAAGQAALAAAQALAYKPPRRRLTLSKIYWFNDLPWNPAHRYIQGWLQGMLRSHTRLVQKAAAVRGPDKDQSAEMRSRRLGCRARQWLVSSLNPV